jgi:hypothetical protein
MNQLLTLREVLSNDELPYDHHLCLPAETEWNAETRCAIVESDEINDPDQHPLAVAHELTRTIGTNEVLDILINAREQLPKADFDKLLDALLFYCDNDAFIDFENEE